MNFATLFKDGDPHRSLQRRRAMLMPMAFIVLCVNFLMSLTADAVLIGFGTDSVWRSLMLTPIIAVLCMLVLAALPRLQHRLLPWLFVVVYAMHTQVLWQGEQTAAYGFVMVFFAVLALPRGWSLAAVLASALVVATGPAVQASDGIMANLIGRTGLLVGFWSLLDSMLVSSHDRAGRNRIIHRALMVTPALVLAVALLQSALGISAASDIPVLYHLAMALFFVGVLVLSVRMKRYTNEFISVLLMLFSVWFYVQLGLSERTAQQLLYLMALWFICLPSYAASSVSLLMLAAYYFNAYAWLTSNEGFTLGWNHLSAWIMLLCLLAFMTHRLQNGEPFSSRERGFAAIFGVTPAQQRVFFRRVLWDIALLVPLLYGVWWLLVAPGQTGLASSLLQQSLPIEFLRALYMWGWMLTMVVVLSIVTRGVISVRQFTCAEALAAAEQSLQEAQRAEQQAAASNAAKTQFLSNFSFQMRNPLNSVFGVMHWLPQQTFDRAETLLEPLAVLSQSAQRLNYMVESMLDLSRLHEHTLPMRHETVTVHELLNPLMPVLRQRVAHRGLALNLQCDQRHSPIMVDVQRARQLLNELLDNALKFTAEGHITVSCFRLGDNLQIKVADSGSGIEPTRLEQLNSGKSLGELGMGAALCSALAQAMGADLVWHSQPGKGCSVILTVPILEAFDEGQLVEGSA